MEKRLEDGKGFEKTTGVDSKLVREFMVEPRKKLEKLTIEFLDDYYLFFKVSLKKFVKTLTVVKNKSEIFQKYFAEKLEKDPVSFDKKFNDIKSVVKDITSIERIFFTGNTNFRLETYLLITDVSFDKTLEDKEKNKNDFDDYKRKIDGFSEEQQKYSFETTEFAKNFKGKSENIFQLNRNMTIFVEQIGTIAYLLLEMLPPMLKNMGLLGAKNLKETFDRYKIPLGDYYDEEEKKRWDKYQKDKPDMEKTKKAIEMLMDKYPIILPK